MEKKQYHTILGAVISLSLLTILIFYLYFDIKYQRDKQVFVEINQIRESIVKIKELNIEQQDKIDDLKDKYELITVPDPVTYKSIDL
ncbi:MAG TPA: hypothetical protein DEG69_18430, partial [Flavobacteriaceae bacterium]|nr:hypothetical protein [Flavobacteriaceae bacterium]